MALHSVGSSQCHVYRLYALKGTWLSTDEQAMDTVQYALHSKYKTGCKARGETLSLYIDEIYCLLCPIFTASIFSKIWGDVLNSSYKGAHQSRLFTFVLSPSGEGKNTCVKNVRSETTDVKISVKDTAIHRDQKYSALAQVINLFQICSSTFTRNILWCYATLWNTFKPIITYHFKENCSIKWLIIPKSHPCIIFYSSLPITNLYRNKKKSWGDKNNGWLPLHKGARI
jgi:hypothetical protein